MRIIVMGTGPFAVPSAEGLLAQGHDVPLVVTRPLPDPPPKKLPSRPVADWANFHKLPLFEPASINAPDAIEHLKGLNADLFFVCDYGQILSKACLSASRLGGINLHGSILPRHRGAAPVQWSILSGDSMAGVTVIWMTPKLDGGPIVARRSTPIGRDESAEQLEPRLAELGTGATLEAIDGLNAWDGSSAIGDMQDNLLATKAPRFSKQDGQLDFRLPADYLVRLIRACQPWPGTFAELNFPNGKSIRLLIKSARESKVRHIGNDDAIGAVRDMTPDELKRFGVDEQTLQPAEQWERVMAVQTGEGLLLFNRVQPAGKRDMTVAEFVRGHKLEPGVRFSLPDPPARRLTV